MALLDIVIATGNRHKFRELKALLALPGVRWKSLHDYGPLPPIQERGRTFEANAGKKAAVVARATGCLAVADDSGLEVDALGGAPGVRSARFSGRHGDNEANNRKLLRVLTGLPVSRRGGQYCCALALADPSKVLAVVTGRWRGRIADEPLGRHGFGYDPIFVVPRLGKTVGQLPDSVKQRLSHRAAAARRLRPILSRLLRQRSAYWGERNLSKRPWRMSAVPGAISRSVSCGPTSKR